MGELIALTVVADGDGNIVIAGSVHKEDFLGLGTVFTNSSVPQGTVYATARENVDIASAAVESFVRSIRAAEVEYECVKVAVSLDLVV